MKLIYLYIYMKLIYENVFCNMKRDGLERSKILQKKIQKDTVAS